MNYEMVSVLWYGWTSLPLEIVKGHFAEEKKQNTFKHSALYFAMHQHFTLHLAQCYSVIKCINRTTGVIIIMSEQPMCQDVLVTK